jgi:protein involved in polysaccharide export with SLBB domain
VDNLAPAAEYVVGPGDELLIRAWGQVEIDVRAVISREGTISIPRVGVVSVAGTHYQDLTASLRAAVARLYKNFELSVSLGRLRSIQVFVVGQVVHPGVHTVSSLSTLLNALLASGGPSPTGTMRRVELRRGAKLMGRVDLYDLLLKGNKSRDLRLQSGDVIFVPSTGPVAAVAGGVKSPAIYELIESETPLADLIEYAGGTTTTADLHSIQLERLDPDRGRVVRELPWTPPSLATPLHDGDVVQLRTLSQRFDNAVTLRGNVAFPIRTEWKPGLTVSGLIPDRRVLIPETYWERAAARSTYNPHADLSARVEDPRTSRGVFVPGGAASLENPRRPDAGRNLDRADFPVTDVANLLDEVNWDYAVIERLDRVQLVPRLIPFDLRKAVIDHDPASDLSLEPGDIVTVFSQNDVRSPSEKRTYFVRIEGEVKVPGIYQVRPGDTLKQLVGLAGGFSRNAYLFGAEFTRERVRKEQQAKLDEVARRAEGELENSGVERLSRATTAEEASATRTQLESQRATIGLLRSLKSSGRMVLELEPESSSVNQLPDLALEDGDRLFVPNRHSTVGVYGAVYNPTSLIYKPGKRLEEYLDMAGGTTRSADTSSAYVLRADGSVYSRRHSGFFSSFNGKVLMPNDAVVVPEDYAPISWVRELKDWSQIFYQFGLGVAAIRILR